MRFPLESLVLALGAIGVGDAVMRWRREPVELKRKLAFLHQINALCNPRFGVDRTVKSILQRLITFYGGEHCLLIVRAGAERDGAEGGFHSWRVGKGEVSHLPLAPELAQVFLASSSTYATIYHEGDVRRARRPRLQHYDVEAKQVVAPRVCDENRIIQFLEASFVSVPLPDYTHESGRLFLSGHSKRFEIADIEFLSQVMGHLVPLISNIGLVDRLASDAAEEERFRIARDIHDSVIQPYIGLQMGIESLRLQSEHGADLKSEIERLGQMCEAGTVELRAYVSQLKDSRERGGSLVPALRRFATKFTIATGVDVEVVASSDIRVHDRLSAATFQMVAEGLSNIHRHTLSRRARVELVVDEHCFLVHIENFADSPAVQEPFSPSEVAPFVPGSLTERARSLGGTVRVQSLSENHAVVTVHIPL